MMLEDGPASSLEMPTLTSNQRPLYQESLKAYKSTSKYVNLKAKVNPSQKSATNPHIIIWSMDNDSQRYWSVKTGHCTCMAGWVRLFYYFFLPMIMWYVSYIWNFRRGEVCSHVAAVLFEVETACRLGYTKPSCTSLPCAWNQAFSVKVSDQYTYCVYVTCTSWLVYCTHCMCMRLSSVCVCVDARCKDLYSCLYS